MEQLFSAFGIDWRLLLAQAINFGIVLVALRYFLYRPVLSMLTQRQVVVAKGVQDAEQAATVLAGAHDEAVKRVTVADTEAAALLASAREAGTAEKTRLVKEAEERAAALTRDAEVRAVEAAKRLARESEHDIARVVVLAAETILKKKYD